MQGDFLRSNANAKALEGCQIVREVAEGFWLRDKKNKQRDAGKSECSFWCCYFPIKLKYRSGFNKGKPWILCQGNQKV